MLPELPPFSKNLQRQIVATSLTPVQEETAEHYCCTQSPRERGTLPTYPVSASSKSASAHPQLAWDAYCVRASLKAPTYLTTWPTGRDGTAITGTKHSKFTQANLAGPASPFGLVFWPWRTEPRAMKLCAGAKLVSTVAFEE